VPHPLLGEVAYHEYQRELHARSEMIRWRMEFARMEQERTPARSLGLRMSWKLPAGMWRMRLRSLDRNA
jgi:hypothetical protein